MPEGTASRVDKLEIIVEHYSNNPNNERFTLLRAGIAADSLLAQVFGDAAPAAATEALRNGQSGTWR